MVRALEYAQEVMNMSGKMNLNPQQLEAVHHTDGPLLISAGAGSGKTAVLVHRIEHLVKNYGVNPSEILAVTFTNKAANEMKERVAKTIGSEQAGRVHLSTFHSMCVRFLRQQSGRVPYVQTGFTIYTPSDVKDLLKQIIKDCGYTPIKSKKQSDKLYVKPEMIYGYISSLKNEMIDVHTFLNRKPSNPYIDWEKALQVIGSIGEEELDLLAEIYPEYQKRLAAYNALDFDDLLLTTVHMFLSEPGILSRYQNRFQYVMVDEYQDTNHVQYILIQLLVATHRNLAVVGDDFQSIYGFRGSDIRNILSFDVDYPDAKVIKLEQNYRSTKTIIQAANELIAHNVHQKEKTLFTDNEQGDPITFCTTRTAIDEADYVADQIMRDQRVSKRSLSDYTILYRSNAQSGMVETVLANKGIPYKIYGGMSFFDRAEIRDCLAYLQFIDRPVDPVHFSRIVNQPKRDIGEKTVEKILNQVDGTPILAYLENPKGLTRVNSKAKAGIQSFVHLIKKYRDMSKRIGVASLLTQLLKEIDYTKTVFAGEEKSKRREKEEHIEQLILMAQQKEEKKGDRLTITEFLEDIILQVDNEGEKTEGGVVKLMTIHASKGLEFPVVFVIGMKENGFPSPHSKLEEEIEEERRLCYVAFTRAEEKLYLLFPSETSKRVGQHWERTANSPSRFLQEFDRTLLEETEYYGGWY